MAGIAVVASGTAERLAAGPALGRHLVLHAAPTLGYATAVSLFEPSDVGAWATIAAGVACWALIGASAAWDSQRRGWHDRLTGAVVVRVRQPDTATVQASKIERAKAEAYLNRHRGSSRDASSRDPIGVRGTDSRTLVMDDVFMSARNEVLPLPCRTYANVFIALDRFSI